MISTLSTTLAARSAEMNPVQEGSWIADLQNWVDGLPEALQWLGLLAISAVPFIESYSGPFIGMVVGMPWWAALLCGVLGNAAAVAVLVYGAHSLRSARTKNAAPKDLTEKQTARRAKIKKYFDRFGVPGVAILGPFALPSQFTAPLMVSFGANRHLVMLWMAVSIVLWGLLSVALGFGFLYLAGRA
ncbi:hypothetical protein [Nesterenkonia flava]|uniref:Small multi-drug export protein n=1 Tax=Nesterenkonia flava TaxID=469799 RepID=A0ABU1FT99_9MICC|nr:hypothetical protein [Nesterenkonia flava]MDR5711557.1 hypothetical protein [Nesterenkonia flava]